MTADEYLDDEVQTEQKSRGNGEQGEAMRHAEQWLTETLSNCSSLATAVQELANDAEIALATLKRAKKLVGVKSKRIGFGKDSVVWWTFPTLDDSDPAGIDSQWQNDVGFP